MDSYHVGTTVTVTGVSKNIAGVDTDPTAVTVEVVEPDGVIVSYTGASVTKTATGTYSVDHPLTKAGVHIVRFEGTGAIAAAEEIELYAYRDRSA